MKSKIFFILILLVFQIKAKAQIADGAIGYFEDALRFSRTNISGSARFQGLAGATTALGGDFGNMFDNPAGLGFFRKSEFNASLGFGLLDTDTKGLGNTTDDSKVSVNINSFGVVLALNKDDIEPGKWRGGSFGIGAARINNFQNRFSYEGMNAENSLTDFYVDLATGIPFGDIQLGGSQEIPLMAFNAFLLEPFDDGLGGNTVDYFTYVRDENDVLFSPVAQKEVINTKGGQYQWSFSYGNNYDDKLYLGATLGISTINYTREKEFTEDISGSDFIDSFEIRDELSIRGTGVNLALGFIYRPIDAIRIGGTFTTPSFYAMREEFSTFATTQILQDPTDPNRINFEQSSETLPGDFNYTLITPLKASLGFAIFLGKRGFISADAEFTDYTQMRVRNSEFASLLNADNETIDNIYKPTWNYRLGAEIRTGFLRWRGGFAYFEDPFDNVDNIDRSIINITGGLGLRVREGYFDIAVIHSRTNSTYSPYSFSNIPYPAGNPPNTETLNKFTQVVISGGVFF